MAYKMRVGGMTISPDEVYKGRDVQRLIEVSYANGRRAEQLDNHDQIQLAYSEGYKEGFNHGSQSASSQLETLRETLRSILNI